MAQQPEPQDEIEILNEGGADLTDVYHFMLRSSWQLDFAVIAAVFLASNLLFAGLFWLVGGVANAHTPLQLFYFSVQTMGTIGYGAMYPVGDAANLLVVVEAVYGLILTALCTGLVFAKFSVPRGRIRFAKNVVVTTYDGQLTLMVRLGNGRRNRLLEARAKLVLVRTEKTKEGATYYRMHDLKLVRSESPFFSRSWTALHVIDETSLLFGVTPEILRRDEIELVCTLAGLDDTSGQTMHGRHRYSPPDWVFGRRHADLLTELPDGRVQLDLAGFDELAPEEPGTAAPK
jgi:inward rectifier potassium channel